MGDGSELIYGYWTPFQLHVLTNEIGYGKIRGVFICKVLTTVPGAHPLHNSWLLKDITGLATSNHPGTASEHCQQAA